MTIFWLRNRVESGELGKQDEYNDSLFKTILSSGYILILLSIEYILARLIEMCQGWSRMRNVNKHNKLVAILLTAKRRSRSEL